MTQQGEPTRVRTSFRHRLFLGAALPLAGIGAGLTFALVVELVASFTAFGGIFGAAGYLGEPRGLIVASCLGLVGGAIALGGSLNEDMQATVSNRQLTVTWAHARVVVPRHLVTDIIIGHDLVVLARGGVELARMPMSLSPTGLRQALSHHHYPRPVKTDPFDQAFADWNRDDERLDVAVHQLLHARESTLRARARGDAEMLRRQLARRGVMVRDVPDHADPKGRHAQQWRLVRNRIPHSSSLVTSIDPDTALAAVAEAPPERSLATASNA